MTKKKKVQIGWKKAWIMRIDGKSRPVFGYYSTDRLQVIVKLQVQGRMTSPGGHFKRRCSQAKVLAIQTLCGHSLSSKRYAYSDYDSNFIYRVGQTVRPHYFVDNYNECEPGIHFFDDRKRACNYKIG